jgi:proton glutamate symport protein
MGRTAVNVVGNSLAAIVVSKWEGEYNSKQAESYLQEYKQAS